MDKYQETLDFLYNQLPMFEKTGPGAYKPGLDTALTLSATFGNPHKNLKCIHIAGTNGKGSTSSIIASVLQDAGYKTALYTSPHIFDFRERIRINGQMISEDYVTEFIERYRKSNLEYHPTFFELTTIMAFEYFASENVDFAVIETGLGGRLDTTNIITPLLSIITNVSKDHVDLLGDTIEQIAEEKAGIFKPGTPAVIGEAEATERAVFERVAGRVGAPLTFAEDNPLIFSDLNGDTTFKLDDVYNNCTCSLKGDFQKKNINTAINALRILNVCSNGHIYRGLQNVSKNTGLLGRWTVFQQTDPTIIFDTGHNIGAWKYLAPRLDEMSKKSNNLRVLLGFVSDKDVRSIFELLPKNAEYHFVTPSTKRAIDADSLAKLAHNFGLNAIAHKDLADGYDTVITKSSHNDTVFIGGSNYLIADLPQLRTIIR